MGYGTEREMQDGKFNEIYSWQYACLPEAPGICKGFDVQTEEQLEAALEAAREYSEDYCVLDVRLDPYGFSPASQRMTSALGKKVIQTTVVKV